MTTGYLRKNDLDRWEIVYGKGEFDQISLSCGSVIEVLIGGQWIMTRIEHTSRQGYYAVTTGITLCADLPARVRI